MKPADKGLGIKEWLRGPKPQDHRSNREAPPIEGERIAILPFVNISPDPLDEYFADGMTEELISTLSKIQRLKVISRTSIMRYKQTAKSVGEISKELNVGSILEGSVRKSANDLRITVKLINVKNDEHVWSQDYERKVENVFAVQKEIAHNVVESLQLKLLPEDKRNIERQGTTNIEAYELYLKGRFLWNRRSKDSMTEAIDFFRAATEKDPSFALAHVGLADCYALLVINGFMTQDEGYKIAKKAVARALELDNASAEAHSTLGLLKSDADWNWNEAEREYRKAIELNPNYATAHQWLSILIGATLGRVEEGIAEAKKSLELDPLSAIINLNLGQAYLGIGNLGLAEKYIRKALELEPSLVAGHGMLSFIAVEKGLYQEAIDMIDKIGTTFPPAHTRAKIASAWVYARSGDREKAKQVFENAAPIVGKDYVTAVDFAGYYGEIGEFYKAFEMLGRGFENHDASLCTVRFDPWLRSLSSDPRFAAFLEKMKVL